MSASTMPVAGTGDRQAKVMTEVQPMKMAAAEALYDTKSSAGFSIFTIGTLEGSDEIASLRVPGLLSFLGKGSFDADCFLVDVPGGQLEIRQLGEPPADDGSAIPDRAQLYFAARAELPPNYEPYIEVEFARPFPDSRQQIEFRFIPAAVGD